MKKTVYLIHFDKPYKHARHLIGVAYGDVAQHIKHSGSPLMRAVNDAGITWRIAQLWKNAPEDLESKLRGRGDASRICPICLAQTDGKRPVTVRMEGEPIPG